MIAISARLVLLPLVVHARTAPLVAQRRQLVTAEIDPAPTAYQVFKLQSAPEQRYTLGVAYPARKIAAHGDFSAVGELERLLTQARNPPVVDS